MLVLLHVLTSAHHAEKIAQETQLQRQNAINSAEHAQPCVSRPVLVPVSRGIVVGQIVQQDGFDPMHQSTTGPGLRLIMRQEMEANIMDQQQMAMHITRKIGRLGLLTGIPRKQMIVFHMDMESHMTERYLHKEMVV